MSLLDDLNNWYNDNSYPPEGCQLDWPDNEDKTELVSQEDHDELRWGTRVINVYKRGDEYVAVSDVRPATEMQDWGDYGKPEIYEVKPREEVVTIIHYDKV